MPVPGQPERCSKEHGCFTSFHFAGEPGLISGDPNLLGIYVVTVTILGLKRMLQWSEVADVQDRNYVRKMHKNFQGTPFEDSQWVVGNLSGLRPANCFR